jgi:hypothetical protein
MAVIECVLIFASPSNFAIGFLRMFMVLPGLLGAVAAGCQVELVDAVDQLIGLVFKGLEFAETHQLEYPLS